MELWYIPFAGYLASTTASSLLQRRFVVSSKLHPYVSTVVRNTLIGVPFLLCFAAITDSIGFATGWPLMVASLAAVINVLYGYIGFHALKESDAGTFATVAKLHVPLVVLGGSIVLGEPLSGTQYIGGAIMLSASMLLGKLHITRRAMGLLIASCFMLASIVLLERSVVTATSPAQGVLTVFGISYVLRVSIAHRMLVQQRAQIKVELKQMIIVASTGVWGAPLLVLATDMVGNVSITSSLGTSKVLFVALFAALLLGERDNLRIKLFAAAISIVGALLV